MRGDVVEGLKDEEEGLSVEKQQEQQLMNKLAAHGKLPAKPASAFLQKKLQQRKFFDSGDYAMDKDKEKKETKSRPHPLAQPPLPPTIPSPSSPPQPRDDVSPSAEDSLQIPRPDTVPQRKASIIYPSVHSKLSPQPHVHHEVHEPLPES